MHKGFDADDTAVELIRRYPAFEEEEQHRKFLVRSICERLVIPGETDDYFTPEELWKEDDRINGKWYFLEKDVESGSDDQSVIEEDSEPATKAEPVQQPVVLKTVPGESLVRNSWRATSSSHSFSESLSLPTSVLESRKALQTCFRTTAMRMFR